MQGGDGLADNGDVFIEMPKGEVRVSVRNLVEFILRQGDIDNRHQSVPDNAMQEGSRIHRMIQKRMGAEYQAEVSLRYTEETEQYFLIVEGRADGIIEHNGEIIIDEIKGTYRDLIKMKEPIAIHLAQAKCYAYIYALQRKCKEIRVRMTYCNIETEDIRYFYQDYTFETLKVWFAELIGAYRKWADFTFRWRKVSRDSMERIEFPFAYREGQKELVSYVYQTIYHKRKLFLEAPTGVGKTIATVFPALKAMSRGMGEKIFYLTAKTITGTVAENTFALLRERGLQFKSVVITAKDKICFLDKPDCNPEGCPYAKGHYDRINDAVFDMLQSEDSFSREKITEYAMKHQVCPFEMCLDMSLFADGIIGDYNYLFDPHASLKRFFAESSGGEYLFLIDEAHNLLERGREMYSASLWKEDFLELRRCVKELVSEETAGSVEKRALTGQLTLEMTSMSQENDILQMPDISEKSDPNSSKPKHRGGRSIFVRHGYADKMEHLLGQCNSKLLELKRECEDYCIIQSVDQLMKPLMRLHSVMDEYLDEQEEVRLPIGDMLLEFYFQVSHFLDIYERLDENYVKYTQMEEDGRFQLKLFCVNPCVNLRECMGKGRSSILFSATFLPIQYYKSLLGGEAEDYEVYAKSVFDPTKRGLFIARDVTSKYTRRSEDEYYNIARYISEIVKVRSGNYMVFCPSYAFLQTIYEYYLEYFVTEQEECLIQQDYMKEAQREEFLKRFAGNEDCDLQSQIAMEIEVEEEETLIGFCVLGGIFGEGIDLKRDSLIGAVIVGTGIPQVCNEREILKRYFDEEGESGFDYSYRYPGMNKVLQAAGRVIRTAEDIGVVALLDERFLQFSYRKLFPREWESFQIADVNSIGQQVESFWEQH